MRNTVREYNQKQLEVIKEKYRNVYPSELAEMYDKLKTFLIAEGLVFKNFEKQNWELNFTVVDLFESIKSVISNLERDLRKLEREWLILDGAASKKNEAAQVKKKEEINLYKEDLKEVRTYLTDNIRLNTSNRTFLDHLVVTQQMTLDKVSSYPVVDLTEEFEFQFTPDQESDVSFLKLDKSRSFCFYKQAYYNFLKSTTKNIIDSYKKREIVCDHVDKRTYFPDYNLELLILDEVITALFGTLNSLERHLENSPIYNKLERFVTMLTKTLTNFYNNGELDYRWLETYEYDEKDPYKFYEVAQIKRIKNLFKTLSSKMELAQTLVYKPEA